MTLQASGTITLANIQGEFGGSNPISLSEYYRGGASVPNSSSPYVTPIPTSGPISLSQFYNTRKEIDPPVAVNALWMNTNYTTPLSRTAPVTLLDAQSTMPTLTRAVNYSFEFGYKSVPAYEFGYCFVYLYVNGARVYSHETPRDPNYSSLAYSWYRSQNAAITGSYTVSIKGDDVVRYQILLGSRTGSGTITLETPIYCRIRRTGA